MHAWKTIALCLLIAGHARADAPPVEIVRPVCADGRLQGIVLRVAEPGIYGIRWGADVCRGAA